MNNVLIVVMLGYILLKEPKVRDFLSGLLSKVGITWFEGETEPELVDIVDVWSELRDMAKTPELKAKLDEIFPLLNKEVEGE
jgi:hypothetical protein